MTIDLSTRILQWWCSHPFDRLTVYSGPVLDSQDADFINRSIRLRCVSCGAVKALEWAEFAGGAKAFLERGFREQDAKLRLTREYKPAIIAHNPREG